MRPGDREQCDQPPGGTTVSQKRRSAAPRGRFRATPRQPDRDAVDASRTTRRTRSSRVASGETRGIADARPCRDLVERSVRVRARGSAPARPRRSCLGCAAHPPAHPPALISGEVVPAYASLRAIRGISPRLRRRPDDWLCCRRRRSGGDRARPAAVPMRRRRRGAGEARRLPARLPRRHHARLDARSARRARAG